MADQNMVRVRGFSMHDIVKMHLGPINPICGQLHLLGQKRFYFLWLARRVLAPRSNQMKNVFCSRYPPRAIGSVGVPFAFPWENSAPLGPVSFQFALAESHLSFCP